MADSATVVSDGADDFEDDKTALEKFLDKAYTGVSGVLYAQD